MRTIILSTAEGLKYVNYDESTGNYTVSGAYSPSSSQHTAQTVTISKKDYASNDTNITVDQTFNQLVLTCELEELENLVDSPTDEDKIYSPFYNKQLYCKEYAASGDGSSSMQGFKDMLLTGTSSWDGASIITHYVQLYKSNVWKFNSDALIPNDHTGQLSFFKAARQTPCLAFLAEFGSTKPASAQDNSIPKAPDMQRYLVITINGNGQDESGYVPTESQIKAKQPVAEYVGNIAGGFFSPTDDDTTNYIVIEGKIIATSQKQHNSKILEQELSINQMRSALNGTSDWMHSILISASMEQIPLDQESQGNGYRYAVEWYDAANDKATPYPRTGDELSLYPYNSDWKSLVDLNYNYSAFGEEVDKIFKFPLLQCTLKVGDKYACEMIDSEGKSYYEWHTLEDCPYETYNGVKEPRNHIYIGPDLAIDDDIIGKEYDIPNSVQPEWGIDASGIAIPIKKSDGLSGKVSITIDGPVNSMWEQICRKHPTFFRSTKWWTESKRVLSRINQIMIKDFTVDIHSDNAQINNISGDNDLIYQTEELTDFVEKKDDIEFKLSTALTTEECVQKGLKNTVLKNNPYIGEEPLRSIYNVNTGFSGKPEEQYLSDYWPLYSSPMQIIETTVRIPDGGNWTSKYRVSGFNPEYYPMSISYNMFRHSNLVRLRQC